MKLITQHLVINRDLNAYGNVFGGTVLSWLDEAGAVYVTGEIGYSNIVTVSMNDVNFRNPAKLGDIIKIYSEVTKTGKSSITLRVDAVIEPVNIEKKVIIDCQITYVCLDEAGKPFPYFNLK